MLALRCCRISDPRLGLLTQYGTFAIHADRLHRVSKAAGSQSLDLQRDALRPEGIDDAANLYHDFASGLRDDRPGLDNCLRALRKGDAHVVWKLDRLGRNLAHRVRTVQDLSARSVGLRVLAGQGAQIGSTTAAGHLVFCIFAALAGFERELSRGQSHGVIINPYKLAFNS